MNTDEAYIKAIGLITEHGLVNWSFSWSRSKNTLGCCSHSRRTIELSKPLTEHLSESEVLDTILHEIAHALVGPGHNHDNLWKLKARQIGTRPERCAEANDAAQAVAKWIGTCPGCGVKIPRNILREKTRINAAHTACKKQGKPSLITWERNDGPKPEAEGYTAVLSEIGKPKRKIGAL